MAPRRRISRHAVKRHHSYTLEEAGRALGVSRGTIRRWLKNGLPAIVDQKPFLILGDDLNAFLAARRQQRARCGPAECYCFKCRAPRPAAEGMADFIPLTPDGGNLRALCASCGTLMHKRISARHLAALMAILDLSFPQGHGDIG